MNYGRVVGSNLRRQCTSIFGVRTESGIPPSMKPCHCGTSRRFSSFAASENTRTRVPIQTRILTKETASNFPTLFAEKIGAARHWLSNQSWASNGVKTQSGIVFNSTKSWNVYSGPHRDDIKDFRRVAVHELGHTIGLGHEDDVPAIMQTAVATGDTIEVPQADDIAGVEALYGRNSSSRWSPPRRTICFRMRQGFPGRRDERQAATLEPPLRTREPGSGTHSVWWQWRAPQSGTVTIDTRGSSFDTTLGVYTGSRVDALNTIAENDDADGLGLQSRVILNVTAGTTYRLRIAGLVGLSDSTGNIVLNWNLETAPHRQPVRRTICFRMR